MAKGDILRPSKAKTRDRCYLRPGVVVNGFSRPQPIKATILQSQQFEGGVRYHVLIDGESPPGKWYDVAGIDLKQGALQPVQPAKQAWVRVRSPDGRYTARFQLDQNGVDSYLVEGYEVILDDDKNPA